MTGRGSSGEGVPYLERACEGAMRRARSGYYSAAWELKAARRSLTGSLRSRVSVIAELKPSSPTAGSIRSVDDPRALIAKMIEGGADAISVLTVLDDFGGRPEYLRVASELGAATLMKDFVVTRAQLEFAARSGASAVLLIARAFRLGLCELDVDGMIGEAHDRCLEVLLEVYRAEDLDFALRTDADLIGVNSRDLETLDLNLEKARAIVAELPEGERWRTVVESGIGSRSDVEPFLGMGVNKFLVGTAVMRSQDPAAAIRAIKGE
ncbi:MAG: indole-3-glycerol-phosphate synthase [Candidatus Caldarchaeales archaeon]